jgi:DNA-binding LacI/PurR family transcriptional regulator
MQPVSDRSSTTGASRPATILDIARHLGLSKTTVSAALTGNGRLTPETRDLVLRTAQELNYRAHPYAQSLRNKNSGEIVLLSGVLDLGVTTRKMTRLQERFLEAGFTAPIYAHAQQGSNTTGNQRSTLASVARVQPRAIVCNFMELAPASREILLDLQAKGTVIVCYDSELESPGEDQLFDQVIFDREDNTYQATRHLIELGHRDLGLVLFSNSPTSPIRLSGFERALKECGLDVRPEWVFQGQIQGSAEFLEMVGANAAHYFASLDQRPTGVCILNDLVALAFAGEIGRAGLRVPQDMSIVGHDNSPICQFAPLRLSSVSHPVEVIVDAVSRRVMDRLQDESLKPSKQWIRGEVFARDSSAPPGTPIIR